MRFHDFFYQIHLISVSRDYMHLTLKICQIVAGTSMIRQFHEFFESIFLAGFCHLAQL